jgi:soluble lytic murein transglycosylase-like protein
VSIANVTERVTELQSLITGAAGQTAQAAATPAPTASPTGFAAQLASATGAAANRFASQIDAAAARNGIDPALLTGLIRQESGFDPNAVSSAGAVGLTQLMPSTAQALGVADPRDPAQSIEAGARYLREQLDRFGGDATKALAAYNAGPGAVERFGGVPPYSETQQYVRNVLSYARQP